MALELFKYSIQFVAEIVKHKIHLVALLNP